jgi:dipeptidase D
MQMDGSLFNGEILLNLDTEDDDELSIGCAGGIDTNTSYNYQEIEVSSANKKIEISIRGLLGGHSGMDIDKGRGNANKWMSRILWTLSQKIEVQLISFDGGSLRNAIPREATAVISISPENFDQFNDEMNGLKAMFLNEYNSIEPAIIIQTKEIQSDSKAVATSDFKKIISLLCSVPNGVFRMSPDIEGLVEASSSLARVIISNGIFTTQSLQRSSVESTKAEIAMAVQCSFENIGCGVVQSGEYPGWKPDPNSAILKIMEKLYSEMFNEAPKVKACHAGLECGILGKHLPGVDMISFGPNIRAAHSPDEKVQISSVQKFWKFYLETLKQTPIK